MSIFLTTPPHQLSSSNVRCMFQLQAKTRSKLFSLSVRNTSSFHGGRRAFFVGVIDTEADSIDLNALKLIGVGEFERVKVLNFSPPKYISKGAILAVVVMGTFGDTYRVTYEASEPMEHLSTIEDTTEETQGWLIHTGAAVGGAYNDSDVISLTNYDELIIEVKITVDTANVKILASFDGTSYDVELLAAVAYAINDQDWYRITEYYPFVKVQFQKSGAAAPTMRAYVSVKRSGVN